MLYNRIVLASTEAGFRTEPPRAEFPACMSVIVGAD